MTAFLHFRKARQAPRSYEPETIAIMRDSPPPAFASPIFATRLSISLSGASFRHPPSSSRPRPFPFPPRRRVTLAKLDGGNDGDEYDAWKEEVPRTLGGGTKSSDIFVPLITVISIIGFCAIIMYDTMRSYRF